MNDITNRYLEFYNYLKNKNIIKNSKDFSLKIDVSASMITEIIKGRSNVGVRAIQNSVLYFSLNPFWLFTGKGSMLKTENSAPETKEDKIYKELFERKEQELREAYKEIGQLQARLEDLNKDKTNKDTHYKRGKNAS